MKKIISICMAVLLAAALCVPAQAAGDGRFLHTYYSVLTEDEEQYLVVLGAELPSGGSYKITLASQSPNNALTNVAEVSLPTTVYCVVDTSSAIPQAARQKILDILNALNASMHEQDIMVLLTVGGELIESEPLTTAEQRRSAISDITWENASTNLYQAVSTALDSLKTKNAYTSNKCLLVLSDGVDDGKTSVTEDAVLTKIEDTTLPVFGVGVLQSYPQDYSRNKTKTLERMADASVGGAFYETSATGQSASDIAANVWSSMQNASVVVVDLAELDRSSLGDSMLLTVSYTTTDNTYEDSITVLTKDLPEESTGNTEPSDASIPATTIVTEPEPEPGPDIPLGLIIGIGAAVIAVAAAVIVVVVRKKKSAEIGTVDDSRETTMADLNMGTFADDGGITTVGDSGLENIPDSGLLADWRKTEPTTPCLQLCFTTIGHRDQVFRFTIPADKSTVLGRDNRADVIVAVNGQTDPKLSGRHCALYWTSGKLYVSDQNSTNGTAVNGSKLVPGTQQKLEQNDLLRIGGREFRVSFYEAFNASQVEDYRPTTY